ncbi:MAG TPA: cobyric acid synthase CobQ, partial [Chloroflexota bacterium]|nr:cobyric acid synthase CobQ [Chloroflexota bacterium]
MTARMIMVQGSASSVGKSVVAAGLCRLFARRGVRVAPFKAQNMSLNAGVTADGLEMGRAQIAQAEAAGIAPHVDMNPILLKPEADTRAQVIVLGQSVGSRHARDYFTSKTDYWPIVAGALDRLRAKYDLIVAEGAGSPAEVNLRDRDIVNMRVATYANAAVL